MPAAPLKALGKLMGAAGLDAGQNRLDEGPCLAAMRDRQTVQIDSMHTETRWQGFCRVALAAGLERVVAVSLRGEGGGAPQGRHQFFLPDPLPFTTSHPNPTAPF